MKRRAALAVPFFVFGSLVWACRGVLGIESLDLAVTDGAADGGASDAPADNVATDVQDGVAEDGATTDSGCDAGPAPTLSGASVPCPTGDCIARQDACCLGPAADAGQCIALGNSCAATVLDSVSQECLRTGQCGAGFFCCLATKSLSTSSCPARAELARAVCSPDPTCGGGIELCAPGDGCQATSTTCRPLELTLPRFITVGACL